MSKTLELISAISEGDAIATEQAFNAAMAEKISVKLDDMRASVAKSMFNPVVEEEILLTQEQYDALSEEEKLQYQEVEVELEEGLVSKAFGVVDKVTGAVGDAVKGTAGLAGKAVGGVAKTVGAVRQTPAAIGAAYNMGRAGAQKAIAK